MVDWHSLTRMDHKARAYERETYFREAYRDFEVCFDACAGFHIHRTALVVVKPDGIAAGKVRPVLEFLQENGFDVTYSREFVFSRLLWRELWRYQLTAATLDRLSVNDLLYAGSPALLLILRDVTGGALPATVRLASVKGSADVSKQRPGTLRAKLRQPTRVLSFVHIADEPADLVREFGLLLDRDGRRQAFSAMHYEQPSPSYHAALRHALDREQPIAHPFDIKQSLATVARALRRTAAQDGRTRAEVEEALRNLERVRNGELVGWQCLAPTLEPLSGVDKWDLTIVAASAIVADEPGAKKAIDNPEAGLW